MHRRYVSTFENMGSGRPYSSGRIRDITALELSMAVYKPT